MKMLLRNFLEAKQGMQKLFEANRIQHVYYKSKGRVFLHA